MVATTVTGVAGAALTAVPFLASWKPSAARKALGAPVEADISKLEPGAMIKVNWRGQAIFIVHRSPGDARQARQASDAQLRDPDSKQSEQPQYAKNDSRAQAEVPGAGRRLHAPGLRAAEPLQPADAELGADWPGGFYCPCHGSKFDLSGRVFKDVPAPLNLDGAALPLHPRTPSADRRRRGGRLMSATVHETAAGERSRMSALVDWIDALPDDAADGRSTRASTTRRRTSTSGTTSASLALVVLVLQIVTGIFLTMNYKPSAADAFASVEYIMRDVEWGWLIRYMHSTGASAFFIVVYCTCSAA